MPAFSLERTQELVYVIRGLKKAKRIPNVPVYIDSPLAVNVTDIFRLHPECFDHETNQMLEQDEDPFGSAECTYVRSVDASKRLNGLPGPLIILSASGMCEAGRILHHLANNCEDPKNTILIVGYQAEGTLGDELSRAPRTSRFSGISTSSTPKWSNLTRSLLTPMKLIW